MSDPTQPRTIGVALLGCGIVGGGVADLLLDDRELLRRRTGVTFELRHVVVRDPHRADRRAGLPISTDAAAAIADPRVDVVVELIGGTTVAADHVAAALRAGKPVVTANKSLLAARGPELFALARQKNVPIAFEASCGGGIPIVGALVHGLVANRIDALVGIVNGTCNFILTQMTRNGWAYDRALAEAQRIGFAESDPTLDVSGRDAAQKLAVLAGLAFNARVLESDVSVEGIDTLDALDLRLAGELGYVIKLLAIGERATGATEGTDRLALRVHPTLVHKDDVLADVSGGFNAISVYGHAVGHALFYGRGAGRRPTASAVVADLVDVALGTAALTARRMNVFPDTLPRASVLPMAELAGRYYLRLTVRDEPGVFAQITAILGHHRISLSAVLQHEAGSDGQSVPVVITTHQAKEGAVQAALAQINALPAVSARAVCLRIIDPPQEFAGATA
jgi:homoserine dehydrogenase